MDILNTFTLQISALFMGSTVNTGIAPDPSMPWWLWPCILFFVTFFIGIIAVLAGVGGGVIFVPIISSFFPFHLDFVRGAGLLIALTGALASGPRFLESGLANLRLAMPLALISSVGAICGALVSFALPTNILQMGLGLSIILITLIMMRAQKSDIPYVEQNDSLALALKISGMYYEQSEQREIHWKVHRTPQAIACFVLIGFVAGMFGLGAGWANVPVLNIVMGAPLKVAVGTSKFILSITDTSAAWIYFNKGAIIPLIVAPSIIGIIVGSRIGVKLLFKINPRYIKRIIICTLLFAGIKSFMTGIGY